MPDQQARRPGKKAVCWSVYGSGEDHSEVAMSESSRPPVSPLGQALGRVPSGLFVLTVRWDGRETGMLASWVQQAGFEPPMLTVALKADGLVREWVERSGSFVLNQIATGQKMLLRHFARGFSADA